METSYGVSCVHRPFMDALCSLAKFVQHGKKKKNHFAVAVCLTFSTFCLRNDVGIATAVSFWRDPTAGQRSEAGKRE